jgi:uncharacterized protein YabN with tetrapyrrole methylase and pyrophosphatase domain
VLAGIVPTLPSLLMAYRLQERAASVGFDWPGLEGPVDKVREELREVEDQLQAQVALPPSQSDPNSPGGPPSEQLIEEIGDLLFTVVNLARKAGVQPGPALDRANQKFRQRFEIIERLAVERGIELSSAGLQVLDGLWDEAKSTGTAGVSAAGRQ